MSGLIPAAVGGLASGLALWPIDGSQPGYRRRLLVMMASRAITWAIGSAISWHIATAWGLWAITLPAGLSLGLGALITGLIANLITPSET